MALELDTKQQKSQQWIEKLVFYNSSNVYFELFTIILYFSDIYTYSWHLKKFYPLVFRLFSLFILKKSGVSLFSSQIDTISARGPNFDLSS